MSKTSIEYLHSEAQLYAHHAEALLAHAKTVKETAAIRVEDTRASK